MKNHVTYIVRFANGNALSIPAQSDLVVTERGNGITFVWNKINLTRRFENVSYEVRIEPPESE